MKVSINDTNYPQKLKVIKNPPECIYCKGNIKLLEEPGIAIIGSRTCTDYGEKMAIRFAKNLSEYGITIISGMAKGIDSFAHVGALEVEGNTIAVLPSGLNNIFPKENEDLYHKILEKNGLVLTEYQDDVEADSKKFLDRNRIVSALSMGILVVEGGKVSGTSVTARLAKEQGKKVFCIPSSLENPKGAMPNKLIKEGAFLVTDVEDIINEYPELNLKKQELKEIDLEIQVEQEIKIKDEYKNIYSVLNQENATHINELAKKLKLDISEISSKLMMMELEDLVISLPGNNFKKV